MKQPLRETLKRIGGSHLLNENNISDINKFWSKDVKLTSPEGKSMKKENAKLIQLLNKEAKKLGATFSETLRFTGPQGSKIQVTGGKQIKLKPNATIKDIVKQIQNLTK